jgi:hypothetical protein
MKPDAVQQILEIVGSVAQIDASALSRADQAIRREFGGCQMRIQPRAPVTMEQIDAGLRQRKPVAMIAYEVGLSRATIYRMLGRKAGKNRKKNDGETVATSK